MLVSVYQPGPIVYGALCFGMNENCFVNDLGCVVCWDFALSEADLCGL